jgi:hypothetical protein
LQNFSGSITLGSPLKGKGVRGKRDGGGLRVETEKGGSKGEGGRKGKGRTKETYSQSFLTNLKL